MSGCTDPETDPDRIQTAVLSVPAVVALHGGAYEEIATYLPSRRIAGIRADTEHVEVHVMTRYGTPLVLIGAQIREALHPVLGERTLTIAVDDILLPGQPEPDDADHPADPSSAG